VHNTPLSHVTRDWQEQTGQLGDLVFRVMDTSGMEPSMQEDSIQVLELGGWPLSGLCCEHLRSLDTTISLVYKVSGTVICKLCQKPLVCMKACSEGCKPQEDQL